LFPFPPTRLLLASTTFIKIQFLIGESTVLPLKNGIIQPGVVVHTYNLITWKAQEGEWQVQGQPVLHVKTLPLKKRKKKERIQVIF
jgi:hypothetical protein